MVPKMQWPGWPVAGQDNIVLVLVHRFVSFVVEGRNRPDERQEKGRIRTGATFA
jgi:hypothetical protein